MVVHSGRHVGTMHSKEHWETFCEGNGSFTAMMQKTRGKQNALPAPGLKNMPYEVTARYTAKLTCCTKMLDPTTEAKRGNWTTWVPHGTMGLKCVNVPRIMRVGAPSFRSILVCAPCLRHRCVPPRMPPRCFSYPLTLHGRPDGFRGSFISSWRPLIVSSIPSSIATVRLDSGEASFNIPSVYVLCLCYRSVCCVCATAVAATKTNPPKKKTVHPDVETNLGLL